MIKEYLNRDFSLGKLHNTYLICCDDTNAAMDEVLAFLSVKFFENEIPLKHSDFTLVKKLEGNIKNISVDQIRNLQNFLNKTSIISGKKAAIILEADQMNLNASNSCLKILEDTPKNTHIFLISSNPSILLPTIRSRCAKINHNFNILEEKHVDDYYVKPFLKSTKIVEHLEYLKDFGKKDRDLWIEFTNNAYNLLARIIKKITNDELTLSQLETQLFEQFSTSTFENIIQKYDKIVKITEDTIHFDLDLRASYLILVKI